MGDYSRDPVTRLSDSLDKHYVAVRLQQGVPLLDADWNMLDDLRRDELETVSTWSIGDGVPSGSDGFAILALPNGGQNTLVLQAVTTTNNISLLSVDITSSSSAVALGFTESNAENQKAGSAPARLVSLNAAPFGLVDGDTLVLSVDEQAPISITFNSADFADIALAAAGEIISVINAVTASVIASVGDGNDFIIRGGDGTLNNAGRILLDGQMVLIESDIKYSEQDLYENTSLAAQWEVSTLSALTTPAVAEPYIAYLDVWNREVDSIEDNGLVDVSIGIETAIRLRREWVVRVAAESEYATVFAARPSGHYYYPLVQISRSAGVSAINQSMLSDLRQTDNSLRRQVAYRSTANIILVDNQQFQELLIATRENIRGFMQYLVADFVDPNDSYVAGEVIGVESLSAITHLIDQGLILIQAKNMGTQDALAFLRELQFLEQRFVQVWTDLVLPLNKPGGQVYGNAFSIMVNEINSYLAGPAPGVFITLPDALDQGDLHNAVVAQERINSAFGEELDKPVGFLTLTYLGSTTPTILTNQSVDLRYEVSGSVTPEDEIDVDIFVDPSWSATLRNSDNSIPFSLQMGPGVDDNGFIVSVQAPNVAAATTAFSLLVYARGNKGGLRHVSTAKTLTIGDPPPPSEEGFVITIQNTNLQQVAGVFQFPTDIPGGLASMNLSLTNNTLSSIVIDISFEPAVAPPGWTIIPPSPASLEGITVAAESSASTIGFGFLRPGANGSSLDFVLRATEQGTSNVVGEVLVRIVAV